MGYTTEFEGSFALNTPLTKEHKEYLDRFSYTRRMRRNELIEAVPDPLRIAVGLPVGIDGEYFVNGERFGSDFRDPETIAAANWPPRTQPGLWCQWVPNEDGTAIVWDGGEKFYYYREWLEYLTTNFFERWGYILNGRVTWEGEDPDDVGCITVNNNVVTVDY